MRIYKILKQVKIETVDSAIIIVDEDRKPKRMITGSLIYELADKYLDIQGVNISSITLKQNMMIAVFDSIEEMIVYLTMDTGIDREVLEGILSEVTQKGLDRVDKLAKKFGDIEKEV